MHIVLIATSETDTRDFFESILADSYTLLFAENLNKLTLMMHDKPVDLVILDEMLDDRHLSDYLSGILGIVENVPLILMVTEPDTDLLNLFTSMASCEIIQKPLEQKEMLFRIQKNLEYADLAKEVALLREAKKAYQIKFDTLEEHILKLSRKGISTTRSGQAESLAAFHKGLANIRDLDRLYHFVAEAIADIFLVSRVALIMREADTDAFVLKASVGLEAELFEKLRFDPGRGIPAWFARNDGILAGDRLDDLGDAKNMMQIRKETELLHAKLCVPLMKAGKLAGFLSIGDTFSGERFGDDELKILFRIAADAFQAIENAKAYSALDSHTRDIERILQTLDIGIVATDAECTIAAVNRTAARLLAIDPEHVTGKHAQMLGSAFSDILMRTLKEKRLFFREDIASPATKTPLRVSTSLLEDADGGDAGAVLILSEVSPELATGRALHTNAEAWDRFSERLSDYIGNTLVPISTFEQVSERKYDDKELSRDIEKLIKHPAKDLDKLLDSLSSLADSFNISLREHDMQRFLTEFLKRKELEFEKDAVKLVFESKLVNRDVTFDMQKLARALENVLQNSFESFSKNQKDRRITVLVRDLSRVEDAERRDMIEISITDNGQGIEKDYIEEAIEPFSSSKGSKRLGLGLFMARTIVERHKGSLLIESEEGKGTTLRITLPRAGNGG